MTPHSDEGNWMLEFNLKINKLFGCFLLLSMIEQIHTLHKFKKKTFRLNISGHSLPFGSKICVGEFFIKKIYYFICLFL